MDKSELLEIRAAILDALAFLETLRRGPDGELGSGATTQCDEGGVSTVRV